ncbi:MAG: type II secretion system F family protein [Candidatus Diapherotrites archaeon]|nr:type II secretion system F family protein [Candidatus Diapherotrites archaeon]
MNGIELSERFEFLAKYKKYMNSAKLAAPPEIWIVGSIIASAVLSYLSFILLNDFFGSIILLLFLGTFSLGYPYMLHQKRIEDIDKNLPGVLREIATSLKSGGTMEHSLKEVIESDHGAMTHEIKVVIKEMRDGKTFSDAMKSMARRADSQLLERSVFIIVDAVKAGASIADVLEALAEDIRKIYRLKRDRVSKTTMQFMFIIFAGGLIAPVLFGLSVQILHFMITSATSGTSDIALKALDAEKTLTDYMTIYLIIEAAFSSLMISIIRTGKFTKVITYGPMMIAMAYFFFKVGQVFGGMLLGA